MRCKEQEYIKIENNNLRLIRTEILLTPILVILPLFVGGFLIYDWYFRGFILNNSVYDGELILGIIILFANIAFDVPFIKSLIKFKKKI